MKIKMKKYSRAIAFAVMLIMIIILSFPGCTMQSTKNVKEKLNEKYGEEFVIIRATTSHEKDGSVLTAVCHPSSDPELCFEAVFNEATGEFSDKYREAVLSDEMEKEMKKHLTTVSDESEIIIDMESFSPDYEREISPKEYNSENKCVFYAIVVINKDKSYTSVPDELYLSLSNMLESVGECDGGIGVYLTDDETLEKIRDHASEHPEMGSEIIDMCPEGFMSAVTGGKMEKTLPELEAALY